MFRACETRFTGTLDDQVVAQLYRSGCRRIEFGLESYNQRVLDLMRKEVTVSEIDRDVASCLRGGISVHLFGIVGFPGETEAEARRTIDFIDSTLNRAQTDFGVSGSTSGLGGFQLDPLAPMAARLPDFGVRPQPTASELDLTLMTLGYQVARGVGADEVSRILSRRPRHRPADDSDGGDDGLWFHAGRIKQPREESLVRACHGLAEQAARRLPVRAWPGLTAASRVWRAPDTSVVETRPGGWLTACVPTPCCRWTRQAQPC